LLSPACDAFIEHVPAAIIVTVEPLVPPVVQTAFAVLAKVNGFPDAPPAALTINAESPYVLFGNAPNVIGWSPLFTVWITLPELVLNPDPPP
jgi:hypothetical protein